MSSTLMSPCLFKLHFSTFYKYISSECCLFVSTDFPNCWMQDVKSSVSFPHNYVDICT